MKQLLRTSFLSLVLLASARSADTTKPNIIFIVADDLGWNDVGYNNPDIISPNLDSLALNGIILNQSYVQPICSPSRSAFMTGNYPYTMGLQHMVILDQQDVCVPLDKTFLPQVLKQNGYITHAIGKWHLGFCRWECTPTYRGFDSFYGFLTGGEDYYTKIAPPDGFDFRFNRSVERIAAGGYSAFQYADRAEDIIKNHDTSNPLFIYLPFQSVHMPLQVPQNYTDMYPNVNKTERKILSGMVTAMDDAIGQVVSALKTKGIYDNTLFAFSSDNGGWTAYGGNNLPLRGGKISIFEGGTRVPAFLSGPMLKQKGVTYDGMMHAVDWFPTLVAAAGVNYTDPNQDGVNQWDSITNLGDSKRTEFIYNMDYEGIPMQGSAGIRVGDYKLIDGFPGLYTGWYAPESQNQGIVITVNQLTQATQSANTGFIGAALIAQGIYNPNATYKYLFNLKDDPYEKNNLYNKLPDVVKRLENRMADYRKKFKAANFPPPDPEGDPANYGGLISPGWC